MVRKNRAGHLDKQVARLYVLWLLGILVGAVQLRPETIQFGGISYTIKNVAALQGVIFVACIVYYIGIFGNALGFGLQNRTTDRAAIYHAIYEALDAGRRTLIRLDTKGVKSVKMHARARLCLAAAFLLLTLFIPFIHILFLQQSVLLTGIDTIFHTSSVKDGQIDLASGTVALLTFGLLSAWTYRIAKWIKGKGFDRAFTVNILAITSYSWVESIFRSQDTFYAALTRNLFLQLLVFLLFGTGIVVQRGLDLWFFLTLLPVKIRQFFVKRREKKLVKRSRSRR